jgi:hypothetical protein
MKTLIAITDLTRMQHGNVCVAGYNTQHNPVRLVQRSGISEEFLYEDGKAVIYPWAAIEVDLLRNTPDPPHCEDYEFDPDSVRFDHRIKDDRKKTILGWSLAPCVENVFDQPVQHNQGCYVLERHGTRSLGTVMAHAIKKVDYSDNDDGAFGYRLVFKSAEQWYSLKITDLTFTYYCHHLLASGREHAEVQDELTAMLRHRMVFVRIGLARHWKLHPDRCYLQINGIHTFPDYLQGKTFADFKPINQEASPQ